MKSETKDSTLKALIKQSVKFLSTLFHNTIVAILLGVITIPVLISWATGTLSILFQTITSPTPLWATIALGVLLGLYIFARISAVHPSQAPQSEYFLIEDSELKWKVTKYNNGSFSVSDIPYCKTHNSQYVITGGNQYVCRELVASKCDSKIINYNESDLIYQLAKSKAESLINNYNTKS